RRPAGVPILVELGLPDDPPVHDQHPARAGAKAGDVPDAVDWRRELDGLVDALVCVRVGVVDRVPRAHRVGRGARDFIRVPLEERGESPNVPARRVGGEGPADEPGRGFFVSGGHVDPYARSLYAPGKSARPGPTVSRHCRRLHPGPPPLAPSLPTQRSSKSVARVSAGVARTVTAWGSRVRANRRASTHESASMKIRVVGESLGT